MGKLRQTVATVVLGLGTLFLAGCSGPAMGVIMNQPPTGVNGDYPARIPLVRSIPLSAQSSLGTQAGQTAVKNPNNLNVYADGTVALSGLPWFHQGMDRTCAQANIASVMNYWGQSISYTDVVKQMNPNNMPTDPVAVTGFLRNKGLAAQDYRKASVNFLKKQINDGKPVIVMLDFGDLASEHYVTVKGYNDRNGDILYNDPVDGPNMLLSYGEFEKMWQNKSLAAIPLFGDKYAGIAFDVAVK